MAFTYGLYPWTWNTETESHEPPAGSVCCLDLRPLAEQAKAGQSGGWGFFAWQNSPPADLVSLGSGDCREIQPTTAQRDELRLRLGLSANPSGTFLTDCVADILGPLSDPTGTNGPKPVMPTAGVLEIHLDNHSRVWNAPYDRAKVLSGVPGKAYSAIRDVIRDNIKVAFETGGKPLAAKVLGSELLKHGYSKDEVAEGVSGKRSEWARLLPPGLLAAMGGANFKPERPRTSYTDDFNRSDGAVTTPWSYTRVSGNAGVSFDVSGNVGYFQTTAGSVASDMYWRYDSDVSSVDHWSEFGFTSYDGYTSTGVSCSPAVRISASGDNLYYRRVPLGGSFSIFYKMISGTITSFGSSYTTSGAVPRTVRMKAIGSTITFTSAGVDKTATDTSISGNTRGGIHYRYGFGSFQYHWHKIDNWLVDDGIVAGQPSIKRLGGVPFAHSLGRGVW